MGNITNKLEKIMEFEKDFRDFQEYFELNKRMVLNYQRKLLEEILKEQRKINNLKKIFLIIQLLQFCLFIYLYFKIF